MDKLDIVLATLEDIKLTDIVVYDMRGHSPFFDHVVLSSANNPRQLKAALSRLKEAANKHGGETLRFEGADGARWVLADWDDVVVNIFTKEERAYYNIERMWHDIPVVEHKEKKR